jgi:ribulose-5-phosphate 4-epimerase/fuculose-1-phosphate aldolase
MSTATSAENKLRDEICDIGRLLFGRGYTVGSAGNISARLEDGWLITPTDACLGRLDPTAIAKVNLAGEWVSGDKPSKTLMLHREVYDRNPGVGGVVHTHSTHQVMKVGHIPLITYERPGSPKVAEQVAKLANSVRGVMLERLGPVVWESSVAKAAYALEELEETARLWLMSNPKPEPLDAAALEELRQTFGVNW